MLHNSCPSAIAIRTKFMTCVAHGCGTPVIYVSNNGRLSYYKTDTSAIMSFIYTLES